MARNGEWRKDKACNVDNQDLFFSPDENERDKARDICAICPVQNQCLQEALRLPHVHDIGIWGGTDEKERQTIKRRLKRREAAALATT